MQRGSAQLFLIIIIILLLLGGGVYFFQNSRKDNSLQVTPYNNYDRDKTYTNKSLGFEFEYQNELAIKEDTEEEFNQRAAGSASKSVNGNFRKNFKGYVAYEPGKFLGGVMVLDKDQKYETNPFTVWVFDNENNLTIDQWYQKYWYYPFVWGDFTSKGKIELAPKDEATISGELAKSGVIDYQPGKPKFVYVSKDQKMYLFRIIGESGDKILESFKLQ